MNPDCSKRERFFDRLLYNPCACSVWGADFEVRRYQLQRRVVDKSVWTIQQKQCIASLTSPLPDVS
jgi:hypothetical protein